MKSLRNPSRRPTHPGAILREDVLPALAMAQARLAELLGVSRLTVSQLLNEHRSLSPDMAMRLEKLLGSSAESWLRMQEALDLWEARQQPERFARIKRLPAVATARSPAPQRPPVCSDGARRTTRRSSLGGPRQNAGMTREPDEPDSAGFIPFEEFRNGLPHGRFRVIVNPALAVPFVAFHTRATPLALAIIGPGIAAALLGHAWTGGLLVAAGVLLRRSVKTQAPRILLHLSQRVRSVYEQATEHGVMEVRRA